MRNMVIPPLQCLLPDCMLPKDQCEKFFGLQKQQPHQHILPQQQRIFNSSAMYLFMQGGVGGGKSEGFAAKCVYLALSIPKNRGVVVRHNFGELFDTSWRKVMECIQRLVERELISPPQYAVKEKGNFTEIVFANGSELHAIHGKNWRQGLGADHGFFWVDDALECVEEFFVGTNVTAGLLSRLRLPHVRFARHCYDETLRPHGALHGMLSSNPPPYGHFLHKLFGSTPGLRTIGQDTVEFLKGETLDNPFTGGGYAKSLIGAQKQMNRSDGTIRRVVFGESIAAYKGIPVFPQFEHRKHVASLKFNPLLPLICGWDFGFRHPGITYHHIYKCKFNSNHLLTLSEVGEAFNLTVHDLYKLHHKPHMDALYKEAKLVLNCGDRAGWRNSSSSRDGRSDMKILMHEYHLPFKWRFLELEPSLQYMRGLLKPKAACQCGMEMILISEKCPILIGALEGGYHYPEKSQAKKPTEDMYFADIACSWRYTAENYIKWGVPYEDAKMLRLQQVQEQHAAMVRTAQQKPYGWMDLPDDALVKLAME